jgi:hypothetical protein
MKLSEKAERKKEQIIADLIKTRRKLLEEAAGIEAKNQERIFLGTWCMKDLLAHLIGWDLTNIQAVKDILSGALPTFYSQHDKDWKTYNANLVAQNNDQQYSALLRSAEKSNQQLANFLMTIPANEFTHDRGIRFRGYKVTIERLLQAEIRDEGIHHLQTKEFKEFSSRESAN